MAFHVACPITCRKICYCTLGFPRLLEDGFLEEVDLVEEFLKDPWRRRRVDDGKIVQVKVPKVVVVELPVQPEIGNVQLQLQKQLVVAELVNGKDASGVELDVVALENASAQSKKLVLEKKAAATSEMVEDLARRLEAGDVAGEIIDRAGEKQGQFKAKIMCCLCLSGEKDGTKRASKMFPCRSCGKKYHISCLKSWSQDRDLFHWSSWACPSCRVCEVCRQTGDPNKFMFCRRCDAAYHCYCHQPPHKNVSSGPYLCPKHTKCHSCGSNVPGNGSSVRWFLGYTCCDACGRLFVKGNYCPVCLKVYRDSESTPMVCCDICQRWVHCQCDGISDQKYDEFQVDENLQYACPTCRGDCCQVRNPEEAVVELWRRRDEADKDLIASLREAAGLPTLEEIFSISPFSDDDDNDLVVSENECGRSIKFSLKCLVEKSSKKIKHGKKSSKKKYGKKKSHQSSETGSIEAPQDFVGQTDLPSSAYSAGAKKIELSLFRISEHENLSFPGSGSLDKKLRSTNQTKKHKSNPDIMVKSPMFGSVSTPSGHSLLGKGVGDQSRAEVKAETEVPASKDSNLASLEYDVGHPNLSGVLDDVNRNNNTAASSLLSKDSRSPLKLKFKKPHQGKQVSWINKKDDEMSLPKGQRSKRKRPSPSRERASAPGVRDSAMDEIMDANWILQKLGKDAVGKRVEVHQATDNSWHRGTVGEVFEGTSVISVALDDGNSKNLELGKQGVCFVSQKRKS